jgi:hypothetical protein|tara:strand:- start:440 stop:943 length:504 start_codon:yes stop_codon:yes gene_type:complete
MTKKLEELFELPTNTVEDGLPDEVTPDNVPEAKPENNIVMQNTLSELDKVQAALPQVRGLEASDTEMDDLADKATKGFDDLMDLGMNVDSRWASDIFGVASTMLGHAITAKTAKLNKKLKMVDLQLKKANLDQKVIANTEDIATGTGVVLDRNALLDRLLNKDKEEK